jgi:Tfp pilus assembly protein PilN
VLLVALLGLLVPAAMWFARATDAYARTASQGEQLRHAVETETSANTGLDALATRVAVSEDQATQLEAALASLGIRRVVWSETLATVMDNTPAGIRYTEVNDQEDAIRLEGTSPDERAPLLLVQNLAATGAFGAVRLEALDRITADIEEPTATPTARPGRPRATPSPTPTASAPEPAFTFVLTIVLPGASTP